MEEVSECWGLSRDVRVVIREGRNGSVGANGEHRGIKKEELEAFGGSLCG